jgi:outer membrane autotransporter protein
MDGNTTTSIVNVNDQGARATGNGILVVEAVNGATSNASAFSPSGYVAAGAFD